MLVKALSLYQPHADLIAMGVKTIETRTWFTSYTGPLLICAAKKNDKTVKEHIAFYKNHNKCTRMFEVDHALLPSDYQPRFGVAVALANLYQCRKLTIADAAAACVPYPVGAFGFFLKEIYAIPHPFNVQGQQGLFTIEIPDDLGLTTQEQKSEVDKRQLSLF